MPIDINNAARSLLREGNISGDPIEIELLSSGGNNRTYRVFLKNNSYIMKIYFRSEDDSRDRLRSEYMFLKHSYNFASNWVPMPIAVNYEQGIALYEFIGGRRLEERDISLSLVKSASDFFVQINSVDSRDKASGLPVASEACFSIAEHISLVEGRIEKLRKIAVCDEEDVLAEKLIDNVSTEMLFVSSHILQLLHNFKFDLDAQLSEQNRCISPSDFGFHNAIYGNNGFIKFIDFEYAGWDDPAKMVGDFFSQLAVPVSDNFFETFIVEAMKPFSDPELLIMRARILKALYQIKWCCIALNIFLPVNLMRRKYANPDLNVKELKQLQISKAETLLATVRKTKYAIC